MLSKMSNDKDAAKKYFVYSTSKVTDEAFSERIALLSTLIPLQHIHRI